MNSSKDNSADNRHTLSIALLFVCAYIFLVIERPWESIRYLEGIPIERPFAILMILVALATGKLKIVDSPTNKWVFGLLALHFILAPFAFNTGFAVDQGIEYAKMVVLYVLMMAVADDERMLKTLVAVYIGSTFIYMLHSLWEYNNGRHVFRMGIARMIGVDSTLNDPNAFGATAVLSLPFVYVFLRTVVSVKIKLLCYAHVALAILCVVLTGSRTAMIALVFLFSLWVLIQKGQRRVIMVAIFLIVGNLIWMNMPDDKQDRIRTLWDEEAGNASAHESAKGRLVGWEVSWEMFKREPLTGVGAGGRNFIGYRMNNQIDKEGPGSPTQSHVLYGQVLAELGILGAVFFSGLFFSIAQVAIRVRRFSNEFNTNHGYVYHLSGAILFALLLLLLFGLGGHNFYRPLWLWLAAWSGIMLKIVLQSSDQRLKTRA